MSPSMERELASLSEGFCATINTANEWLLIGMSILMFPQILWQCKSFNAILTLKGFHFAVYVVVPLKRKLSGEFLIAVRKLTFENLVILHMEMFEI